MRGKRLMLGLAITAMSVGGGAMAGEIYKWTDENGNVHYEDRPSGAASAERLALSYSRTNSSAVQKRVQARLDADAKRAEARTARNEDEAAAEQEEADADAREKMCVSYRDQLRTLDEARRLYRLGPDGERNYLDDEQIVEARQKAQELIAEHCSS